MILTNSQPGKQPNVSDRETWLLAGGARLTLVFKMIPDLSYYYVDEALGNDDNLHYLAAIHEIQHFLIGERSAARCVPGYIRRLAGLIGR